MLGRDGRLVGIVTDRDAYMAAHFTGGPLALVPVSTAMSRVVFTARPDDSIAAAEKLMRTKQVRRLPVVGAAGAVVGMLSIADIARAAPRSDPMHREEIAATIAAIVQPRTHVDTAS